MSAKIEIRRTYKYRLYVSKRDFRLHDTLNISGIIWNQIIALQQRGQLQTSGAS
jgi:hypothetical protein